MATIFLDAMAWISESNARTGAFIILSLAAGLCLEHLMP